MVASDLCGPGGGGTMKYGEVLSHAYILSAPAEEGYKAAQDLAASMLCKAPGARPCGSCENCRKAAKGIHPDIPKNYYPYDNPKNTPVHSWRAHANLLFCNWLNYYVYQTTPYDIDTIKE